MSKDIARQGSNKSSLPTSHQGQSVNLLRTRRLVPEVQHQAESPSETRGINHDLTNISLSNNPLSAPANPFIINRKHKNNISSETAEHSPENRLVYPAKISQPIIQPDRRHRGPTQTISFEDEPLEIIGHVSEIGQGRTGTQAIDAEVNQMKEGINLYWGNYNRGIDSFQTTMQFSSQQEAEPQYLNAAFKAVGKWLLEQALDKLGEETGLGTLISALKSIVEAALEESERAEAAAGEVNISNYITGLRNSIGQTQAIMLHRIEQERIPLGNRYTLAAETSPEEGQPGATGHIAGDVAQLINDLRRRVAEFHQAIPNENAFQQRFTERFADTGQMTDYISQGGRMSGILHLPCHIIKDGDTWSIDEMDNHWTLATTAPSPERLAFGLETALARQNQFPYQSQLPKMVDITVEIEEEWALNSYYDGHIYFTDSLDSVQYRTNYGPQLFQQAWQLTPRLRDRIMSVSRIQGSSR